MKNNQKLVEENERLIYYVLKKMYLLDKKDEYYDLGAIGLMNAINTYDPDKCCKFTTYAYKCIYNEICRDIEYNQTLKRKADLISLDMTIKTNSNKEMLIADIIPSNVDIEKDMIEKEKIEKIRKIISNLKERRYKIYCSYFGLFGEKQLQQKQLAKIYNTSLANINYMINDTTKKIREEIIKGSDFMEEKELITRKDGIIYERKRANKEFDYRLNIKCHQDTIDKLKKIAQEKNMKYQPMIRNILESYANKNSEIKTLEEYKKYYKDCTIDEILDDTYEDYCISEKYFDKI